MEIIKKIFNLFSKKIEKEKTLSFLVIFLISIFIILTFVSDKFLIEIPKKGGEFHEIIINQNPRFINPILAISETDKALVSLIYSPLLKKNEKGELIANIANYTISKDLKKYTLKLKDDIYFHDGIKMTIDDVIYTIQQIQDPLIDSFYRPQWTNVELEKIDDFTLEINLPVIDYYFNSALELYIIPKHIWENIGIEYFKLSTENLNPTGSGAFKIKDVIWDEIIVNNKKDKKINSIVLEKNENSFWDLIYINNIIFSFFENQKEYKNSLLSQQDNYQNIYSFDKISLDKKFIVKEILEPVDFNLTIKKNNENIFLNNDKIRKYIFDIWKAEDISIIKLKNEFLKNKGFSQDEENNLLKLKDEIITFSVSTGNNEDQSLNILAEKLRDKLRKAGIVLNIKILDALDFNNILRDRSFESIISGYQSDEINWYYYCHSSQKNDPGANIAQFNSHKIDTLLLDLRKISDKIEREKKITELKKEIDNQHLILNLDNHHSYYYISKNISSMNLDKITSGEKRFSSIQNWIINTEKILPFFKK